MDLATLLGLIITFGFIIGAIATGGSILLFVNIPSILIVIGGSISVVLMQFTLSQFFGAFKVAMKAFFHKAVDPAELIEQAVILANVARKEGMMALESQEIDNPFLFKGIQLCVDGHPPDLVRKMLSKDISLTMQRHEQGQKIFKALGDIAPAMGMIGTLIGLVQMLANMDDPKAIGPAMAIALLTTLYGAVIANAFALPIAAKLALRYEEEKTNRSLILETISGIQEGMNPRVLEELLKAYLPENQRNADEAGRKRIAVEEENEKPKCPPPGGPQWLATFADLMSLLMSFVPLLAFSEMDALKFKQLAGSMSQAFGVQRELKTKEIPKGTSIIAKEFTPGKPMPTPLKVMRQNTTNDRKNNLDFNEGKPSTDVAQAERDAIKRLEQLKHALDEQIKKGEIEVSGNDERTIIRIREKGSFASGSATLSPAFFPVMEKIALAVQNTPGKIHISGHTDNIPISTYKFRSNWELSSARAVSILEHMLRYQDIEEERIVIQGHADTMPLVPNTTASNRAMNRRVEIRVVKSPQPKKDPPSLIKFSE